LIYVEVQDSGIGISEEVQERMFSSFSQADASTVRKFGGTGLGLSICKKLIELMGGEIGFVSTEGTGAMFWFRVTLEAVEKSVIKESIMDDTSPSSQNFRILVAEDNQINQKVAAVMLKKLGYEADVVSNGALAVEALKTNSYDLILMDCQMPEMDGFQATAEIRNNPELDDFKKIPIVAVTANAMIGDKAACLAAGMDDYISKPFRRDELDQVIKKWLCDVS